MKKRIEKLLRLLGAERLIFYYVFYKDQKKNKAISIAFEKSHPEFVFPPPFLRFDVIGTSNAKYFFESGQCTIELLSNDLQQYTHVSSPLKVLEWGCGPGRLLQHLSCNTSCHPMELYGVDMYQKSIDWAAANLADVASFFKNDRNPPLPMEENTFDFIYAVSVFTHLSEQLSRVWINEIMRILKPGGIFWFSSHSGKHHRNKLNGDQLKNLGQDNYVAIHSHHDGSQMFEGIHPKRFMETLVKEAGGHVLEYRFAGLQEYQDIWIVSKR